MWSGRWRRGAAFCQLAEPVGNRFEDPVSPTFVMSTVMVLVDAPWVAVKV